MPSGPFGACKVCGIKSHLARPMPFSVSKLGVLLTKSISKTHSVRKWGVLLTKSLSETHSVSKMADLLTNSIGSVLTTPLRMGARHENSPKRSYRPFVGGVVSTLLPLTERILMPKARALCEKAMAWEGQEGRPAREGEGSRKFLLTGREIMAKFEDFISKI